MNSLNEFSLFALSPTTPKTSPQTHAFPLYIVLQLNSPVSPQMAPLSRWMKFPLNTIYGYTPHFTCVLVPLPAPAANTHS